MDSLPVGVRHFEIGKDLDTDALTPLTLGHKVELHFKRAGVDGRKPLGAVIVGGMLLATFLTLYVVPLMYDLVKGRRQSLAPTKLQ